MKIHKTQDYSLFKRIPGNRVLSKPHVNRLQDAIKEDPSTLEYNPIIVNKRYEIIDGQHRFDAIRELELPIFYIQVDSLNLSTVQKLNSLAKLWTPVDYARSFEELGNDNYRIYLEFKNEFKFNHDILTKYMSLGRPMTASLFKSGGFIVTDVAKAYEYCNNLRELVEYYPRLSLRLQALGLLQLMESPHYDQKHMVNKMRNHAHRIQEQKLQNDYAREFERIYNYHSQKDPIRLF